MEDFEALAEAIKEFRRYVGEAVYEWYRPALERLAKLLEEKDARSQT